MGAVWTYKNSIIGAISTYAGGSVLNEVTSSDWPFVFILLNANLVLQEPFIFLSSLLYIIIFIIHFIFIN